MPLKLEITGNDFAEIVAQAADVAGHTGTTPIPGTGTTGTAPPTPVEVVDDQSLPLTLSAPDANLTQEAGTGPDRIDLYVACDPKNTGNNNVAIGINGRTYIENFQVTSKVGTALKGSNHVVIHCKCGPNPKVKVLGVAPGGISGLFFNGVQLNTMTDLVCNGPYDSRGGISVNGRELYMTRGNSVEWTLPIDVASLPPSASTGTSAPPQSATKIGDKTLAELVAALPVDGALVLPEGVITGAALISKRATISGAGIDKTIIDGNGFRPVQDKALLLIGADGVILQDMTARNAAISAVLGSNASGARNSDGAFSFSLRRMKFANCQDGVMSQDNTTGVINVEDCVFEKNGSGEAGRTHQLYMNGLPSSTLNFLRNKSSGSVGGHELKSRMGTTNVDSSTFTTGGNGACIDTPNGGVVNVKNSTLTLPAGAATRNFITHAKENDKNAAVGKTYTISDTVFDNQTGQDGYIDFGQTGYTLVLSNVTWKGKKPVIKGAVTVQGDLIQSA